MPGYQEGCPSNLALLTQETWSVKKLELALWQTRSHDGIGLVQ
jgi:hypothetical protein